MTLSNNNMGGRKKDAFGPDVLLEGSCRSCERSGSQYRLSSLGQSRWEPWRKVDELIGGS
jgi:hypothetical protein